MLLFCLKLFFTQSTEQHHFMNFSSILSLIFFYFITQDITLNDMFFVVNGNTHTLLDANSLIDIFTMIKVFFPHYNCIFYSPDTHAPFK